MGHTGRDDLMHFYESYIRPVLEYACAVWHSSLTIEQSKRIENIQRRAVTITDSDVVLETRASARGSLETRF